MKIGDRYALAKEAYIKRDDTNLAKALTHLSARELREGSMQGDVYCNALIRKIPDYITRLSDNPAFKNQVLSFLQACVIENLLPDRPTPLPLNNKKVLSISPSHP